MNAAIFAVLAIVPAWAQVAKPVAATSAGLTLPSLGPKIAPQSFRALENQFNEMLLQANRQDPIDILGGTRALYLQDYGVVLTTEVSLVVTPGPNPFRQGGFTKEEVAAIHKRKTAQLKVLEKTMREMMKAASLATAGAGSLLPDSSPLQVVYAVRLLYLGWEDTSNLPAQIIMKASLKDAVTGAVQEEVQ